MHVPVDRAEKAVDNSSSPLNIGSQARMASPA